MSDEEYENTSNTSKTSKKGDDAFAKAKSGIKQSELNEQLKEYIGEWRNQRAKEEEELKRLKDKQAKRKEIRAEQDKKLAAEKKQEEDRLKKEAAEKKAAEEEKKKAEMLEAEIKRQEMMAAQKEKGGSKQSAPALDARKEMSKTKEQVEEEMKISLSIRIKPLALDQMDSDELRNKANQIWNTILSLETDKYDYEQRHMNQDYEFKELNERQKIQLRNKAVKKGLDPESFTGSHPPKIRMFSKYERRTDTRTYGDRKKLYEGGCEVMRSELLESLWKDKLNEFSKRPKARLPKWYGERPGKKSRGS
eukprot:GFUD01080573.1.p1 GENE.GFUD01080573.1~~GFUD01080573.1.p1  ORF type:complete len:307 (-),score=128.96 GFUD01080573.1:144-1064(-)